jgi:hypothetical protein
VSYQSPPPGIDPDLSVTLPQLAAAIGPGKSGRPTSPATVLAWCLRGVVDVVLESWVEAGDRLTTWRKYQVFLGKVAGKQSEIGRQRQNKA